MKPSDFWEEKGTPTHPPLTHEILKDAEKQLGVKLPALYVELLFLQNGGMARDWVFPFQKKTMWSSNHVPFYELNGIDETGDEGILSSPDLCDEWELPPDQVLLCGEGHWWIALDYRTGSDPCVSWHVPQDQEDLVLAPSFHAFLDGLVLYDEDAYD